MKVKSWLLVLLWGILSLSGSAKAQDADSNKGIVFFEGSYEQALAEAKKQNKMLFIDFYTVWCGPCRMMSKDIFPDPQVGAYFNPRFVSVKLNAEKAENLEVVKKFKVQGYPTLAFVSNDGEIKLIQTGGLTAQLLIGSAKVATGEEVSFTDLYDSYRKNKDDLAIQQELLQRSGNFIGTLEDMEAEKWIVRMRRLYASYIEKKMGPDLINVEDYKLITQLGGDDQELTAKLVDFINKNLDQWRSVVGDAAAYFVIEQNEAKLSEAVKDASDKYKEYLEKIRGEYKDAYSVVVYKDGTPYDKSKMYYDALFHLYKDKDTSEYIKSLNAYFAKYPEDTSSNDYALAAQDLYKASSGRLNDSAHEQAIKWLEEALKGDAPLMNRINYLVMIGDSYKGLKKYDLAQQYYNQGYVESLQMADMEMTQNMIQFSIKSKLAELELLRK
ncbi:MAG: thioredoxin family protein [Porphyromonadaceae bacterium]|nr:thioredoxin family protein [Porphyromonadaceae bacterium]